MNRLRSKFALADQLEVRLANARGQVEMLTPSSPAPADPEIAADWHHDDDGVMKIVMSGSAYGFVKVGQRGMLRPGLQFSTITGES